MTKKGKTKGTSSQPINAVAALTNVPPVRAFEQSVLENRDPTVEELELALRGMGLDSDPEIARELGHLKNKNNIVRAEKLMIEAHELLADLQKCGGEMEIEAACGFYEMARLAIDGLDQCGDKSVVPVAETKIHWPVMVEPGGNAKRETIDSELKRIKLGTRTSSEVRVNSVLTQPSRHKFVVTLLYWTVQAIHNLDRLANLADKHPERIAHLRADMEVKYKMLMSFVNGYEANEWRKKDLKRFGKAVKALHACPEVNAGSFNAWFEACLALLACITRNEFYLPQYKLRNLGDPRANKREGLDSDRRAGITGALKSALTTVLKIPRKKRVKVSG